MKVFGIGEVVKVRADLGLLDFYIDEDPTKLIYSARYNTSIQLLSTLKPGDKFYLQGHLGSYFKDENTPVRNIIIDSIEGMKLND